MSDNPYESSDTATDVPTGRLSPRTIAKIAACVVVGLLLIALLLPATRTAREPARRNACMGNLKQIALALLEFEDANGTLPPAYTVDAEGNRLHSWRTLLLPYLEQDELFAKIDLTKPWDDPVNSKARETLVDTYMCPSATHEYGWTTYLAVVGPEYAFTGSVPRQRSEFTDGSDRTIMVVDVGSDHAVQWMSPHDGIPQDWLVNDLPLRSHHANVTLAAFLDGHVDAIPSVADPEIRRAMVTIAGGEMLEID